MAVDLSSPPPSSAVVTAALTAGGRRRVLGGGRRGGTLTLTPQEVVVDHGDLRAPLRFAPGSVAVAALDPGPAAAREVQGRFPILRRLSGTAVVPQSEGIEGWVWTAEEASAFTCLTGEAPNVLFVFSPPLPADRIAPSFGEELLKDIAKRTPFGEPALFGLLLRADKTYELERAFERYGFGAEVTDREVPPTQRRHLPGDKPANPGMAATEADRLKTSIAPPGLT